MTESKYADLVTDELLNGLKQTESSNDPYAVNPKSGAMGAYQHMPTTVQMFHKQGIKYNPMDEQQQRGATKQYLVKLLDNNGGDLKAALAQYGGYKTKDPSNYIKKVTSKIQTNVQPQDDFDKYISNVKTSDAKTDETTSNQNEPEDDFDKYISNAKPVVEAGPNTKTFNEFNLVPGTFKIPVGTKFTQDAVNAKKVLKSMSVEDWKKNSILANVGDVAYNTLIGNEDKAKQSFNELGEKGVGMAKGLYHAVTNAPETIKSVVQNPLTTGAEFLKAGIYDPEMALLGGKTPIKKATKGTLTEVSAARPNLVETGNTDIPTYLRKKFEEKQAAQGVKPKTETTSIAKTEITIPEEQPARPIEPISNEKAAETEKLLRDVGVERVRLSALHEDPLEATSQYLTSQSEKGVYGSGMREQIAHEKGALENHFGKIEKELGGDLPVDVEGEISRGKKMKTALDEAQKSHDAETKRLYNKANEELGNNQVQLNDFNNYISKKSNFVHDPEKNIRSGIVDYLKEQELMDEDGKILPMTVKQSENLRQFINHQYNYETSSKVGELVKTIDKDVFQNVGTETYEQARAHFKEGKETYSEPKAIKDLLNNEGVNQKVADEKVMTRISTLDESQFKHLIDTLRQNGKEDAIKEIQTHLVNRIKEAGKSETNEPWNSIASAKERKARSAKLQKVFENDQAMLERINKGVLAGNKLYIPTKYKGAAVQAHLLHTKFGDFITRGSTYLGWKTGLHGGAFVGEALGEALNKSLSKGKQTESLKKEIKQLNNISDIGKEQK
jgi:hypothetical protein